LQQLLALIIKIQNGRKNGDNQIQEQIAIGLSSL